MRYKTLLGFSTTVVGEMLLLKRKPTNSMDLFTVNETVGHVPFQYFLFVFCKEIVGFAEVIRPRVNRGAGGGLEIPCVYKLYGPKPYTDSLASRLLLRSLRA